MRKQQSLHHQLIRALQKNPVLHLWADEIGQKDEGLKCILKAMEMEPKNVNFLLMGGQMLEISGKFSEAYDCFDRVLEISPTKDACNCFQKVIELNPKRGFAYFKLSENMMKLGNREQGMIYYEEAKRLDPIFTKKV